jgi:WD40-like Beta Propeller Repeat
VVFAANGALFSVETSAGSVPRALAEGRGSRIPYAWLPDGKTLLFTELSEDGGADIFALDPTSSSPPALFIRTPAHGRYPTVSPDGAWLAFTSEERGRAEVFVQALNRPGPRRRVSRDGGTSPGWGPQGRRLHWRVGEQIVSVDLDADGAMLGTPAVRATGGFIANGPYRSLAVGLDGRLLLARIPPLRPVNVVNVILNADVEIERLISEAESKR